MSEETVIFIGNKPPMRYVTAMITAINRDGADSLVLKARGRAISRAVDVSEIAKNRFITDLETSSIEIGTEQLPAMDGGTRGVSTIAIKVTRTSSEPIGWESRAPAVEPAEEPPAPAVEEEPPAPAVEEEPPAPAVEEEPPVEPEEEPAEAPESTISDIKGVGKATEEKLVNAGFDTVAAIAGAKPEDLSEKTGISAKTCAKLVEAAKELV